MSYYVNERMNEVSIIVPGEITQVLTAINFVWKTCCSLDVWCNVNVYYAAQKLIAILKWIYNSGNEFHSTLNYLNHSPAIITKSKKHNEPYKIFYYQHLILLILCNLSESSNNYFYILLLGNYNRFSQTRKLSKWKY